MIVDIHFKEDEREILRKYLQRNSICRYDRDNLDGYLCSSEEFGPHTIVLEDNRFGTNMKIAVEEGFEMKVLEHYRNIVKNELKEGVSV